MTTCEHPLAFGVVICCDGTIQVRRVCESCRKIGSHNYPHSFIRGRGVELDSLPVVRDNREGHESEWGQRQGSLL